MELDKFSISLELLEFKVLDVKLVKGIYQISVIPVRNGIECPECAVFTERIRRKRKRKILDLPIQNHTVFLYVTQRDFECAFCKGFFIEPLESIEPYQRQTKRFIEYILNKLECNTIKDVSEKERASYRIVRDIFQRHFFYRHQGDTTALHKHRRVFKQKAKEILLYCQ